MRTFNYLKNGTIVGIALPVFLLAAGCNKDTSSTDTTGTTTAVSPADTNGTAINADNSGKNVRDRNDNTLTPGDQGNSDADRQITQRIRQNVVSSTNNYTMVAKNIKIITANGKVTLRGPVSTDAEKTGIEGIAKGIAGDGNVDNQLEVKNEAVTSK